jgi:hypothetical protein
MNSWCGVKGANSRLPPDCEGTACKLTWAAPEKAPQFYLNSGVDAIRAAQNYLVRGIISNIEATRLTIERLSRKQKSKT